MPMVEFSLMTTSHEGGGGGGLGGGGVGNGGLGGLGLGDGGDGGDGGLGVGGGEGGEGGDGGDGGGGGIGGGGEQRLPVVIVVLQLGFMFRGDRNGISRAVPMLSEYATPGSEHT
jgi:hypothetical protein